VSSPRLIEGHVLGKQLFLLRSVTSLKIAEPSQKWLRGTFLPLPARGVPTSMQPPCYKSAIPPLCFSCAFSSSRENGVICFRMDEVSISLHLWSPTLRGVFEDTFVSYLNYCRFFELCRLHLKVESKATVSLRELLATFSTWTSLST